MRLKVFLLVIMLLCGASVYAQNTEAEVVPEPKQEVETVNQVDNSDIINRVDSLEKELDKYRGDLSLWLGLFTVIITLVAALLGIVFPYVNNNRFEKRMSDTIEKTLERTKLESETIIKTLKTQGDEKVKELDDKGSEALQAIQLKSATEIKNLKDKGAETVQEIKDSGEALVAKLRMDNETAIKESREKTDQALIEFQQKARNQFQVDVAQAASNNLVGALEVNNNESDSKPEEEIV